MMKIKKYVEEMAEELKGAKHYIEKALEYKAAGNSTRYARYKEMSTQELSHAMSLHEFAVQDIEQLKTVFPEIPAEMQEEWDKSHAKFIEKAAWIRQMQAM